MPHYADIIQALAALVGALTAAYGVFKALPILRDRLLLLRERDSALMQAREMRAAADAYKASSEGWSAAYDQLSNEMKEMKVEFSAQIGSAVVYISDLIVLLRDGKKHDLLPPIPENLQAAVSDSLGKREGATHA